MIQIPIELIIEEERRKKEQTDYSALRLPVPEYPLQEEAEIDDDEENRGIIIIDL
tara:strand:+ start:825 stop:989 length:165 start_codon:yes stop_codon:yes gene_type:complete